jgi:hypothetical protein
MLFVGAPQSMIIIEHGNHLFIPIIVLYQGVMKKKEIGMSVRCVREN